MEYLHIFTVIVWVLALIAFYFQIKEHPAMQRRERIYYSLAIISYIIHVVVFYVTIIIVQPTPGNPLFTAWSNMLRIHGGFSLLFKEIVAIIRFRLLKNRGINKNEQ